MSEQQPHEPQKEIFSTQNETIALQTRLILGGEALNPDKKDLPKVEQDRLTDISSETYTLLSSASTQERHQYWQKKGVGEDEAYQQWQQGLVNFVNNPKKTERKQTLSSLKIQGTTINWENFSSQDADLIYQRYFADNTASSVVITTDQGEKLAIASSVDKFVSDVIFSYTEDGKVNFEKLKKDLPVIKAFANIFGSNTSEILEAIILAKAKLSDPQEKQELINQANEEKIVDNQPTRRVNYLNENEERLLRWLTKLDKWQYKRFEKGEERKLPESDYVKDLIRLITIESPEILEQMNKQDLVSLIRKNIEGNFQLLESRGITRRQLGEWVIGKISDFYPSFATYIKNKYQIEIPIYPQRISVIPISGKLGKIINPEKKAAGFITGISPTIFLDLDVLIEKSYELLGEDLKGRKITEVSQEKLNNYLKKVISEMGPHELCHLFSDLGFWQKRDYSFLGKIGVGVAKPIGKETVDDQTIPKFYGKGIPLNEAITHQLIIQWAKDNNLNIDFPEIYDSEREVLYELVKMVAKENQITEDQAFSYFAKALFTPEDFRRLIELLDGHRKTLEGRFITKRPSFTPILYFIMNREEGKIRKRYEKGEQNLHYDITLGFIGGNLTKKQKREIQLMLKTFRSYSLSPAARKELERIVGEK